MESNAESKQVMEINGHTFGVEFHYDRYLNENHKLKRYVVRVIKFHQPILSTPYSKYHTNAYIVYDTIKEIFVLDEFNFDDCSIIIDRARILNNKHHELEAITKEIKSYVDGK